MLDILSVDLQGIWYGGKEVEESTLGLFEHDGVLILFVRQALQESIHVESIQLAATLLLSCWATKILPIRVKQARETSYKSCSDSICVESSGADERYVAQAATVRDGGAARALVDAITLSFLFADRADRCCVVGLPYKTVSLNPDRRIGVADRLHQHIWHDG